MPVTRAMSSRAASAASVARVRTGAFSEVIRLASMKAMSATASSAGRVSRCTASAATAWRSMTVTIGLPRPCAMPENVASSAAACPSRPKPMTSRWTRSAAMRSAIACAGWRANMSRAMICASSKTRMRDAPLSTAETRSATSRSPVRHQMAGAAPSRPLAMAVAMAALSFRPAASPPPSGHDAHCSRR